MAGKKPTPEEIEAARAIVEQADAEEAAKRTAEAEKKAEERDARYAKLREIVQSPAYAEVRDKMTALAPDFIADTAHVGYLANALHAVEALAGR